LYKEVDFVNSTQSGYRKKPFLQFWQEIDEPLAMIPKAVAPQHRRCKEKGMLSATQTHLAKELSNDTASTSHDRGHAGKELLTA
jgi:hypothetical protein